MKTVAIGKNTQVLAFPYAGIALIASWAFSALVKLALPPQKYASNIPEAGNQHQ